MYKLTFGDIFFDYSHPRSICILSQILNINHTIIINFITMSPKKKGYQKFNNGYKKVKKGKQNSTLHLVKIRLKTIRSPDGQKKSEVNLHS